jgi:hypothetical protein
MMVKKGEGNSFAKRVIKGVRSILLEKYAFSIALLLIFVMAFMLSSNLTSAQGGLENFSVISDTYVSAGAVNTNYGKSNDLIMDDGITTGRRRIYIMFNLTNSLMNYTIINKSFLCLYLKVDGSVNYVSAYLVNDTSWGGQNETTLTWNNQVCGTSFNNGSACNLTVLDTKTTTGNNQFICWNVLSAITQKALENQLNISFALKTPELTATSQDEFWSRNYSNPDLRPYLEIQTCTPNWTGNYTNCGYNINASCGAYDNKTRVYYDSNSCGSAVNVPSDNGTCIACDSCLPNWNASYTNCGTNMNASCIGTWDNKTKLYNDNNTCCAITGLESDCIPPTDNSTCVSCNYCTPSWHCGSFDDCVNYWKSCFYINSENATNYLTCCNTTHLGSDCNFTGDLGQFKQPCGEMITTLSVHSDYPYVDCNATITWNLIIRINDTKQDFEHLYIEFPTVSQIFNWTWSNATQQYDINLLFTTEGDYPYVIWSDYPYGVMNNITGTLKVRCPFDICLQGFYLNPKNETNPYKNIHAYATAEFEDTVFVTNWHRSPYDKTLEQYLRPLDFKGLFKTKVFHAPYVNGEACIKLWEKNKTYAFRIVDGEMTFPDGVYSVLNATRMYGAFLFLGTIGAVGTDETYQFYFSEQELHPYKVLFNWMFVIGLILILVVAGILAIYVHPVIAYYLALTFIIILVVLRVILWFAIG